MSKRSLRDKLDGFELRGRGLYRRPFLCGQSIALNKIPLILIYKKGRDLEMGSWTFSMPYGIIYLKERGKWLTEYMPHDGLKDKTVLDLGAGCGESAKFFIENGAREVIAVENNIEARIYLKRNALRNSKLTVDMVKEFKPERHLKFNVDLIKCDIEGYEIYLAEYLERNPPLNIDIILETHSAYIENRFHQLGFDYTEDPIWGFSPPWGVPTRIMYRWARR